MIIESRISEDAVWAVFLRNELHEPPYTELSRDEYTLVQALACDPDLSDPTQNRQRKEFLWRRRSPLLDRLPSGVAWYKGCLDDDDLLELRAPARCGWEELCPGGLLRRLRYPDGVDALSPDLARRAGQRIPALTDYVKREDFDPELILICVGTSGPYTLIDGTHRAAAMFLSSRETGATYVGGPTYIGASPDMIHCPWYNP